MNLLKIPRQLSSLSSSLFLSKSTPHHVYYCHQNFTAIFNYTVNFFHACVVLWKILFYESFIYVTDLQYIFWNF